MKLAVDIRCLHAKLKTGIAKATEASLLRLIPKIDEVYLYDRKYGSPRLSPTLRSMPNVTLRAKSRFHLGYFGRRIVYGQSTLPKQVLRDGCDVLWTPGGDSPGKLDPAVASVLTVQDLVMYNLPETTSSRWKTKIERNLMLESMKRADLIAVLSQSNIKEIGEQFPQYAHKIRLTRLGADLLPHPVLPKESLEPYGITQPYFLFVSTLEPRKNLARTLQAYAALDPAIKDRFQLVVVGKKGWGDVDLERDSAALGIQERVIKTGYMEDKWMNTLFAHARFLVMASLHEGFGMPIVEANAMGTPAIVGDAGAMPEVLGKAGLVVDPYSVDAIKQAMHQLATDEKQYQALKAEAKPNADRFSLEQTANSLKQVFEEAKQIRQKANAST